MQGALLHAETNLTHVAELHGKSSFGSTQRASKQLQLPCLSAPARRQLHLVPLQVLPHPRSEASLQAPALLAASAV